MSREFRHCFCEPTRPMVASIKFKLKRALNVRASEVSIRKTKILLIVYKFEIRHSP
jgi:hypothetical protein